jgi:D-cysteine desulfhydrase family pyridoxal phosphate-dependent enzyme
MTYDELPRVPLARLPTPLHDAHRLRNALGGVGRCPRILLKRDDLTDLALGGNKARKLEFLLGDALAHGATALVTSGGVQSNHARMTAAAARIAGLDAALVLTTPQRMPDDQGNLFLDRLLGAEVHLIHLEDANGGDLDALEAATIDRVMHALRARDGRPYLIPLGGSDGIGAIGYVDATRELLAQLTAAGIRATRLYHASGSRGTQAGLELGARIFRAHYQVIGIAVSPGGAAKQQTAASIAEDAAGRLDVEHRLDPAELITDEGFFGEGYAIPTPAAVDAIRLLARTEGILLDPVYTAKAMAGLLDHIRNGIVSPDDTLVFLHTGGVPGLFAQAGQVLAFP